jgi:hypothetical protein
MAGHVYNAAKARFAKALIAWHADDIRIILCMTNTTVDTDNDGDDFVGDVTTLDEMDGANYVRKALANKAVITDDANDRAELDADDVVFSSLGAGTRQIQGALAYKHVTNDADSPIVGWIEFPTSVTADGTNFTLQWNAEAIFQLG